MKKLFLLPSIFLILGFLFLGASLFIFISPSLSTETVADGLVSPIISEPPISDLFKVGIYDQIKKEKTTDNYPPNKYFPKNLKPAYTTDLDLKAKSYAVMDRDTGKLLMAKDVTAEKQIASLTKIMTALVALEKEQLDREIIVSKKAAEIGESVMGLTIGERYTVEELLYGLLLVSGNDAAEALADSLGRGRFWFIEEMNKKAVGLGLKDTYFVNPTGLDGETRETSSFSTALDLLGLTNYALNNKQFAEIVSTKYHTIFYKQDFHKQIFLENILNFDRTYPGIKGVKTGNTDFAGQTLVSYAEYEGRRIIVVLLDSTATRDDAIKIYKYIFENNIN